MWLNKTSRIQAPANQALISYCSRDCSQCEIFQASRQRDKARQIQLAEEWSLLVNRPVLPRQIKCDGCRTQGHKFFYCTDICKIRQLGIKWQ